ncbi:non-specific lipid transfer protein GPI-anchored 5-like isoform X2 [Arachis stenosperma]|uniref:non-specific lipid transfer protein GPI-anchored 5-like isoform X2 n=1 Tax=Arachis stenosperma TaxID=217475 RepID=UPI0025ABC3F4|nr:non-specific lipid transfer protein GPI-anchored 5-like isoform X2 [Arachis stenosperma]
MAGGKVEILVVVVVVAIGMMLGGAKAQSSCTSALVNLSPCLNYIQGRSSTPSSGCCSQLSNVVRSEPQCLCQVLSGGASSSLGITINQTQALALPGACRVNTPPVSQCKAASPAESPNSGTSGAGSGTIPTTDGGASSGNSIKLSVPMLFIVFAATCASTFRIY